MNCGKPLDTHCALNRIKYERQRDRGVFQTASDRGGFSLFGEIYCLTPKYMYMTQVMREEEIKQRLRWANSGGLGEMAV